VKYEDSLKYYNDLKNSLETAQQEGYQEAQAVYEAKFEEAQKRTEQERKLKEEALSALENQRRIFEQSVLNMHNMGLDATQIAQITNRSIAEIEALLGGSGQ
jgi:hypothetical protein